MSAVRGLRQPAPGAMLPRAFFDAPSADVAPRLLGSLLEHETADGLVVVRLTEVEAYHGTLDPASHAFRGPTARNAVMFGEPGFAYVYFTYGMHHCMNLVCEGVGTASAVLLRAGEVVVGVELATVRRHGAPPRDLARGPARLTVALGIDRDDNGRDVCDPASSLRACARAPSTVVGVRPAVMPRVLAGPRVGVAAAADVPWRFWLDGEPTVSPYRKHVAKRHRVSRQDATPPNGRGFSA